MSTVTMFDNGRLCVWASFTTEGDLLISGQDLGGYPGAGEYEYGFRVAPKDLPAVRAALDASERDDLLSLLEAAGEAIVRRGEGTWLRGLGITPKFSSWVEPGSGEAPASSGSLSDKLQAASPEPSGTGSDLPDTPVLEYEPDEVDWEPADRFTLARAWWTAAQLVRRHPDLTVSRVVDPDQVPLLIVHDAAETTRIQFDMPAWIQYLTPSGLRRITWAEVYAQADPRAIVRTIETETGLGATIDAGDTPKVLTYRTIAAALALGLDSAATWQAVPAPIDVADPDRTDWDLFDTFPNGRALAGRVIDAALHRAQTEGAFVFHQPVWVLLRDLEPVALLHADDGSVHTETGEVDLTVAFDEAARSLTTMTARLFGHLLP